jgi:hypothetical protein
MKKHRYMEEQIAKALKHEELGTMATEVCQNLGTAE